MNILIKIELQTPTLSHFKAFGMTNLQHEIRIPQKIYRRVTMHYCARYDFLRNRRYFDYILIVLNLDTFLKT